MLNRGLGTFLLFGIGIVAAGAAAPADESPAPSANLTCSSEAASPGLLEEPILLASADDRGCCLLRKNPPLKSRNECRGYERRDSCARAARDMGVSWDFFRDTSCSDVSGCP
jgi:hypothetical protein